MNIPITQRSSFVPIVSEEKFCHAGGSARSTKESVMPSPQCYSRESDLVGALQDLLTSQLPSGRQRSFYGTDFGAGPPPLINVE